MEASHDAALPPLLARIRKLRFRPVRERTGLHYVEGFRNFIQALDAHVPIEAILYSEILAQNPAVQKNVRLQRRAGVPVVRVTPEVFRGASGSLRASGVGAIVRQHWTPLADADPRQGTCWIAVRSLRSPGNVGTILRTAEAAGVGGVVLLGNQVDPFDPAVVRASMGGLFRLRLVRSSLQEFVLWKTQWDCRVWGTSPTAGGLYTEASVEGPLVVLFGDERRGLSPEELGVCTETSRIPIVGRADSLNVGVAAGVILYEVLRRRPPVRVSARTQVLLDATDASESGTSCR
ncbi:MAG TPA: RNA methyltransferase [Planctomycetota bacterium]|nr:RNA methyltransferase [Planctomycetota bacterium]